MDKLLGSLSELIGSFADLVPKLEALSLAPPAP